LISQHLFSPDLLFAETEKSISSNESINETPPKKAYNTYVVHINQPDELKIAVTKVNYNLLLNDSLELGTDVSVTGGLGNPHYNWSSKTLPFTRNKQTIKVSPKDTEEYTLNIEDEGGCSTTATFIVNVIEPILFDASVQNINCFGTSSGEIKLHISKGAPPYSIVWENGDTSLIRTGLSSGNYSVTISDQMDQFETKTYTVSEKPKTEWSIDASICNEDFYSLFNKQYNKTGIYTDTLTSKAGCDSIVHLSLIVNETYYDTVYISICEGENYPFFEKNLYNTGWYEKKLSTVFGCDSVFCVSLNVNPVYTDTIRAFICSGDTFHFGNKDYTETGIYSEPFFTNSGCDSTSILQLQVLPVPLKPTIEVLGNTLKCASANVQWYKDGVALEGATNPELNNIQTGNYFIKATNENNCFSFSDTLFVNLLNKKQLKNHNNCLIYPNPNTGEFNVAISSENKVITMELFTLDGKLLFSQPIFNTDEQSVIPVRCNSILKGNYFLLVKDGTKNYSQKITIK